MKMPRICHAIIPSTTALWVSVLAIGVWLIVFAMAKAAAWFDAGPLAARLAHWASILEIMPLWSLLGGVLHQIASQLASTDWRSIGRSDDSNVQ